MDQTPSKTLPYKTIHNPPILSNNPLPFCENKTMRRLKKNRNECNKKWCFNFDIFIRSRKTPRESRVLCRKCVVYWLKIAVTYAIEKERFTVGWLRGLSSGNTWFFTHSILLKRAESTIVMIKDYFIISVPQILRYGLTCVENFFPFLVCVHLWSII